MWTSAAPYLYRSFWPSFLLLHYTFEISCKLLTCTVTPIDFIYNTSSKMNLLKMASLNYTSAEANHTVRATENQVTRWMNQCMDSRNLSVVKSAFRYNLCHKMHRELESTFKSLDTTSSVKEVTEALGEKIVARDISSITHDSDAANLMGLDLSDGVCSPLLSFSLSFTPSFAHFP